MAQVVFLRGVNVGGHKRFQPAALAKRLAELDVVNVGAAGTFVVRKPVSEAKLRVALRDALPFEAELMICRDREIRELVRADPFPGGRAEKETRRFVNVLARPPATAPPLPLRHPAGSEWQVTILALIGPFALSLWRRVGRTMIYPNEVVERKLGIPATTRSWSTISTVCSILDGD